MEKLEKERALNHELITAEESQSTLLKQQLEEAEAVSTTLRNENTRLSEELEENKKEVERLKMVISEWAETERESEANYQRAMEQLGQLQEVEVDLMTQIREVTEINEEQNRKLEEANLQHEAELQELCKQKDQALQDLSVAQQNIAELLGAKTDGIEVNIPAKKEENDPPVLPNTGEEAVMIVDTSAYEALQHAYDNVEQLHHTVASENKELKHRFNVLVKQHRDTCAREAEMRLRVEKCREEYEAKCKELFEVKKQLQSAGSTAGMVASLQERLQEMEDNQQQVTRSWETATQELASRKEELKQKSIKITELEDKIDILEQDQQMLRQEHEEFQDKHDKVMHEKTAKYDEQQAHFNEKVIENAELRANLNAAVKEKGKLEMTVKQLREQLEALKVEATPSNRDCPVCHTKFPKRMSQREFERHVQAHFPQ